MSQKIMLFLIVSATLMLPKVLTHAQGLPDTPGTPLPENQEVTPIPESQEVTPTPLPAESDPSNVTPAVSEPVSAPRGAGAPSTGDQSLVACGPGGASFLVTEVPVGCRLLEVNSPPGQAANAVTE